VGGLEIEEIKKQLVIHDKEIEPVFISLDESCPFFVGNCCSEILQ